MSHVFLSLGKEISLKRRLDPREIRRYKLFSMLPFGSIGSETNVDSKSVFYKYGYRFEEMFVLSNQKRTDEKPFFLQIKGFLFVNIFLK